MPKIKLSGDELEYIIKRRKRAEYKALQESVIKNYLKNYSLELNKSCYFYDLQPTRINIKKVTLIGISYNDSQIFIKIKDTKGVENVLHFYNQQNFNTYYDFYGIAKSNKDLDLLTTLCSYYYKLALSYTESYRRMYLEAHEVYVKERKKFTAFKTKYSKYIKETEEDGCSD